MEKQAKKITSLERRLYVARRLKRQNMFSWIITSKIQERSPVSAMKRGNFKIIFHIIRVLPCL